MSILINMEMPKSCEECSFYECVGLDTYVCKHTGVRNYSWVLGRREDCPLVEVPPHGDLIDRDVLRASFKESIDECHKWANEIPNETEMYARVSQSLGTFVECSLRTKGMPTIIPADKDGESR